MSPRAAWRLEAMGFEKVYEYAAGEEDWAAAGLPLEGSSASVPRIGDLVRTPVPLAELDETVADVNGRIDEEWDTVIVVNDQDVVLGRLYRTQLDEDPGATVKDVMQEGPSTFRPNVSASEMHEYMRKHDLETALVTTSEGVLVGLVTLEDVEKASGRSS